MNDNILPEEKLLRLIRGKKSNDVSAEKPPGDLSVDSKPQAKYSAYLLIQKNLPFLKIYTILQAVFIASCFYLIIVFIWPWFGAQEFKLPQATIEKDPEFKKESADDIKPYEFYLEGIKAHPDIFSSPIIQETPKPLNQVTPDLIKDINLLGILSGENPQAIIEDKKAQKTYYLNKGQFIGEFQVMDIKEGKIILNFNSQTFELNL